MKVNDSTIVGGFGDYADYQHIMKLLNQQTIDDAVIGKWYDYLLYFKFQFTTYFIIWFMCGFRVGWKLTCFKYKNYWQLIYSRWTAEHLTLVHLRVSYYFMIVNSSKVCKWSKPAIEKKNCKRSERAMLRKQKMGLGGNFKLSGYGAAKTIVHQCAEFVLMLHPNWIIVCSPGDG